MTERYAIYFMPDRASPLWHFGSRVLGYDAFSGRDVSQFCPPGLTDERWVTLTTDPRLYGFHATLKAPMVLAPGRTEKDLLAFADAFAVRRSPFALEGLRVKRIPPGNDPSASFFALTESAPSAALSALEADCVKDFDGFRAPHTDEDRARRRLNELSPAQVEAFETWGYPFVLDQFRFHMTLSGRVPAAEADVVQAGLEAEYVATCPQGAVMIDRIGIFKQSAKGARFVILSEHSFTGVA